MNLVTSINQMENLMAENKLLRKMAKVADNFGFDLEKEKVLFFLYLYLLTDNY